MTFDRKKERTGRTLACLSACAARNSQREAGVPFNPSKNICDSQGQVMRKTYNPIPMFVAHRIFSLHLSSCRHWHYRIIQDVQLLSVELSQVYCTHN